MLTTDKRIKSRPPAKQIDGVGAMQYYLASIAISLNIVGFKHETKGEHRAFITLSFALTNNPITSDMT